MSSVPENDDVPVQVDQNNEVVVVVADDMSVKKDGDTDSMSSSIGVLSNGGGGDDDEDGDEAQSKAVDDEGSSLNSLATLEAALPFKRGLSDFYGGKSRTFMNLGEVKSVEELEKEESPLNKRRRLTQTTLYKWGSSSSTSMPHLTHSDSESAHNVEVDQDFKSSTSSTSFNSADSPSMN